MLKRILTFTKAQLSAFIGGITDYCVMVTVTELLHVHYTISIVFGGIIGAFVNFSLNKRWVFHSKTNPYIHSGKVQILKFIFVVANSILLKSLGTYLVTHYIGIDYKISRIIVDLFVSIFVNYTLQCWWVFKKAS